MRLSVSLGNVEEAISCTPVMEHPDLFDVMKPDEGALGANYPWVIKAIREAAPADMRLSATVGDAPFKPGTMAQAALGAAVAGADSVRVGLFGVATPEEAIELMRGAVRAVKEHNRDSTVVAVGYADARRVGSVNPLSVPFIAHESGADGAMLDTAIKDGSALFDHFPPDSCAEFVLTCHQHDLFAALAGALKPPHMRELVEIGTDIAGVRAAACSGGDRDNGVIQPDLVVALRQAIDLCGRERPDRPLAVAPAPPAGTSIQVRQPAQPQRSTH